jgi:hypothetical protein
MDDRLRYACEVAGLDWVPDSAAVTEPYRDPDRPHRWVAFIAGGGDEQRGTVPGRPGEAVLDGMCRVAHDKQEPEDCDCWLVPVYLTCDEARRLRSLQ